MNIVKCAVSAIWISAVASVIGACVAMLLGGGIGVSAIFGFALGLALAPLSTRHLY